MVIVKCEDESATATSTDVTKLDSFDIDWDNILLVYVDGPDDIGKTTLIERLYDVLKKLGYNVVYFKEPMTSIPDNVYTHLSGMGGKKVDHALALGYDLDRMILQHHMLRVFHNLGSDKPIVALIDRSFLSTKVYQASYAPSSWYYEEREEIFSNFFPIRRDVMLSRAIFIIFNRFNGDEACNLIWEMHTKMLMGAGYKVLHYYLYDDEYASMWLPAILNFIRTILPIKNMDNTGTTPTT